jgi:hypothetical protein
LFDGKSRFGKTFGCIRGQMGDMRGDMRGNTRLPDITGALHSAVSCSSDACAFWRRETATARSSKAAKNPCATHICVSFLSPRVVKSASLLGAGFRYINAR